MEADAHVRGAEAEDLVDLGVGPLFEREHDERAVDLGEPTDGGREPAERVGERQDLRRPAAF